MAASAQGGSSRQGNHLDLDFHSDGGAGSVWSRRALGVHVGHHPTHHAHEERASRNRPLNLIERPAGLVLRVQPPCTRPARLERDVRDRVSTVVASFSNTASGRWAGSDPGRCAEGTVSGQAPTRPGRRARDEPRRCRSPQKAASGTRRSARRLQQWRRLQPRASSCLSAPLAPGRRRMRRGTLCVCQLIWCCGRGAPALVRVAAEAWRCRLGLLVSVPRGIWGLMS